MPSLTAQATSFLRNNVTGLSTVRCFPSLSPRPRLVSKFPLNRHVLSHLSLAVVYYAVSKAPRRLPLFAGQEAGLHKSGCLVFEYLVYKLDIFCASSIQTSKRPVTGISHINWRPVYLQHIYFSININKDTKNKSTQMRKWRPRSLPWFLFYRVQLLLIHAVSRCFHAALSLMFSPNCFKSPLSQSSHLKCGLPLLPCPRTLNIAWYDVRAPL